MLAILATLPLAEPNSARAASCCGGSSSADAYVLPKLKHALAGFGVKSTIDWDMRDAQGNSLQLRRWKTLEQSLILGGSLRLHRNFQASISVPSTVRTVVAGTAQETGIGAGDIGLQARYEIVDEETCFLVPIQQVSWRDIKPSIHTVLKASLPSGRSTARSDNALAADVTGLGYWLMDAGIEITKVWGRFGNHIAATAGYQVPERAGLGLENAWRLGIDGSASWFWAYRKSLGLVVSHRRQHFPDVAQTTTNLGLFLSAIWDAGWFVRANASYNGIAGRQNPVGTVTAATLGYVW